MIISIWVASLFLETHAKVLRPISWINHKKVDECSGIIFSKQYKDIVWTHNDSGGKARIFPLINFKKSKKLIKKVKLKGATNHDFEDIAHYMDNQIIIADTGNNSNNRRDLALYIIQEPNPYRDKKVEVIKKIRFSYPDQYFDGNDLENFDSEAIYTRGVDIYLLTKHRSDTYTKLYKFKNINHQKAELSLMDTFDIKGKVTAADSDQSAVVVLTDQGIWLFSGIEENIFQREVHMLEIEANQVEAVALKGEKIYITNEQRQVFVVERRELRLYHP